MTEKIFTPSATPHEENLKAYRSELAERIQNSLPGVVPSQSEHRIPLKKVEWDHIIIALVEARRSETATSGMALLANLSPTRLEAMLERLKADAVMSKFVTSRECAAYRSAVEDVLTMVRTSLSARAWNDDAMKLLRDINEARDARLPQELWNRVTAITGGSK